MIPRSPSLTDRVKSHLKERIVRGAFEEGRIPSETELAAELGVSRTTVRDALSRLEHEGTIYRKQGAGTFVNEPGLQIKSRLEEIWSYEQVLQDHGYAPAVRVIGFDEQPADDGLAADLGIEPGDPLVVMEKIFLENATPVVLTHNRVPVAYLGGKVLRRDASKPVYRLLEESGGRSLAYYLSEIVPTVLRDHRAEALAVPDGTPAISFDEIGFDVDNTPVVKSTSFFRDDLLRFRLIRRRAGA